MPSKPSKSPMPQKPGYEQSCHFLSSTTSQVSKRKIVVTRSKVCCQLLFGMFVFRVVNYLVKQACSYIIQLHGEFLSLQEHCASFCCSNVIYCTILCALLICGWATLVLKISVYHAAACRQTCRYKTVVSTASEYYKRAIWYPFLVCTLQSLHDKLSTHQLTLHWCRLLCNRTSGLTLSIAVAFISHTSHLTRKSAMNTTSGKPFVYEWSQHSTAVNTTTGARHCE